MKAIFLDHLDTDVDHLRRMNELISARHVAMRAAPERDRDGAVVPEPMRATAAALASLDERSDQVSTLL